MVEIARERAEAKLTRRLWVTGRRPDGYHLLDAEMVTFDLADELEILPGSGLEVVDAIAWTGGDLLVPGDPTSRLDGTAAGFSIPTGSENLVLRALGLAGVEAHVRLVKRIPAGAGLGGGSADAAAILRWSNCREAMLAARLGADVPFCLAGGRASVGGIGEVLTPLPFEDLAFVSITPGFGVSTAEVYAAFDAMRTPLGAEPSGHERNDLEGPALVVEPRLRPWRDFLTGIAGRAPVLAGSGSTWFFETAVDEAATLAAEIAAAVGEEALRAVVTFGRSTAGAAG